MSGRLQILAGALLAAGSALAAASMTSAEAIACLLNSPSAVSASAYQAAAEQVAAEARAGSALQRYVLALVSRNGAEAPKAAQLPDKERDAWLAAGRVRFQAVGARTDNGLVWYLLAIDTSDTNLLRIAAEKGNEQALNSWANLQLDAARQSSDANEVRRCHAKAISLFRTAAGKGDANGLYNLGMCFARGLAGKPDDQSAFLCFRAAAEKGHPAAMNSFGWFLREGRVGKPDLPFAAEWFRKAADYGDATACFNLALAYLRGEGVKEDRAESARLMKRAAEGGSPEAMDAWGVVLMRGSGGVKEDKKTAVLWFRKAAERGYPQAMENLVQCYDNGWGVEENATKAFRWKMRSHAARGDASAIAWLEANPGED